MQDKATMKQHGRLNIALTRSNEPGARAQGFVIARRALPEVAEKLACRAQHYCALRLSLSAREAIFWSAEPCDLPWISVAATYLAVPTQRVFLPIGWHYAAPPLFHAAILTALPLLGEKGTPLVLLPSNPEAQSSPVRVLELIESASLAAVDWAAIRKDGNR